MNVLNIGDPGITDVLFKGTPVIQNARAGRSVASGDFDGDGIMDLAIGAPGMTGPRGETRTGAIYIYYGGSSDGVGALPEEVPMEFSAPGDEDAMLYGAAKDEAAGDIMTSGDFNGDGRDDLAIVAQYQQITSLGTTAFTKVYVIYGSNSRLSGQTALSSLGNAEGSGTIIRGTTGTPTFHVSAMTTGDVIGDTADELVFSDTKNNAFYVFSGKNATSWNLDLELTDSDITLTHSEDTTISNTDYFPLYFQNLAIAGVAIGDFNGDSTNDLALGVPNESIVTPENIPNAGQVYVIYGDNTLLVPGQLSLDLIADVKIHGGKELDKAGGPLTMGDFNDDNVQDLMIGEPMSQRGIPNTTGLGQVQVVYGSSSPTTPVDLFNQADITLHLSGSGAVGDVGRKDFRTGQALLAEDVNGDNIDDMTISSPYASFTAGDYNGWVHVVHGGGNLKSDFALDIDADMWLLAPEPIDPLAEANMGEALAVGDFDDDGNPDLAMGAPEGSADGTTNSGYVPLLLGASSKIGCSADPDAIVESSFPANPAPYICQGIETLVTSGNVAVEKGATVMFYSPEITMNPGFKVALGGIFSANDLM